MAKTLLSTRVLVLEQTRQERFQNIALLSEEYGILHALSRLRSQSQSRGLIDIYDEADVVLDRKAFGSISFLNEFLLRKRRSEIARNYSALKIAANLGRFLLSNPIHEENVREVFNLARKSFDAINKSLSPEGIYIKFLYQYCRDEGYPIKEDWFASLDSADSSVATAIINTPLAEMQANEEALRKTTKALTDYLRHRTPIIMQET